MKKLLPYLLIGIFLTAFYIWRYRVAPDVTLTEIQVQVNGQTQPLTSIETGNLLVNYYARWCGECMAEMADLQQLHQSGTVKVIGLTDDSPEEIQFVRERFGLTFPIYPLAGTLKEAGIQTIPTSYLIKDRKSVV